VILHQKELVFGAGFASIAGDNNGAMPDREKME
jgi:hypothetical protein